MRIINKKLLAIFFCFGFFGNLGFSSAASSDTDSEFKCGPSPAKDGKNFCEQDANNCTSFEINWWEELNNKEVSFEETSAKFHEKMNALFNEQITKMTKSADKKCEDKKVDPSILAFNYTDDESFTHKVLLEKAKYQCAIFMFLQSNILKTDDKSSEMITLFTKSRSQEEKMAEEIETSGKAVVVALDALSEMQTAYVIHIKLQCVIASLEKMRDALQKLAEQAVKIPGKYINCAFQD